MDKCTCRDCGTTFPHRKETHNIKINGKDTPITVTNATYCPECKSDNIKSSYDEEIESVSVPLRRLK